jgi:hypothetical protein
MSDLSNEDKLYLAVGRCLTAWNHLEERVANIIEILTKRDPEQDLVPEISIGYWAVVSFEARLKWCNAVVTYRTTQNPKFAHLQEEWSALNNSLIRKAKKRAEVAHGSVVTMFDDDLTGSVTAFVPFFQSYVSRANYDDLLRPFWKNTKTLSVAEIEDRTASFERLRQRLVVFSVELLLVGKPEAEAAAVRASVAKRFSPNSPS